MLKKLRKMLKRGPGVGRWLKRYRLKRTTR